MSLLQCSNTLLWFGIFRYCPPLSTARPLSNLAEDPAHSTIKSMKSALDYAIPYRPTSTQSTQTPRTPSKDYDIMASYSAKVMHDRSKELYAPSTRPSLEQQQVEEEAGLYASIKAPVTRRQRRPLYSEQRVSAGRRSIPHTVYSEDEGVVLHCESESSGSHYAPSDHRVLYDSVDNRYEPPSPTKAFNYTKYAWDKVSDTTYEALDTNYFDRSIKYQSPLRPQSYRSTAGMYLSPRYSTPSYCCTTSSSLSTSHPLGSQPVS